MSLENTRLSSSLHRVVVVVVPLYFEFFRVDVALPESHHDSKRSAVVHVVPVLGFDVEDDLLVVEHRDALEESAELFDSSLWMGLLPEQVLRPILNRQFVVLQFFHLWTVLFQSVS